MGNRVNYTPIVGFMGNRVNYVLIFFRSWERVCKSFSTESFSNTYRRYCHNISESSRQAQYR